MFKGTPFIQTAEWLAFTNYVKFVYLCKEGSVDKRLLLTKLGNFVM